MKVMIIKYFEKLTFQLPGIPDTYPRWGRVRVATVRENGISVKRLRVKEISREKAKKLILENGLVEVYSDRNGRVYDTPDRSFQKQWKGKLKVTGLFY